MIVSIKRWNRFAMPRLAKRTLSQQPPEKHEPQARKSSVELFEKMLEHQADLIIRAWNL